MYYQSVVASVIFFAAVHWGGVIESGGAIKLNKMVKKAMKLDRVDDRAEDDRKAASYNGQSLSPSATDSFNHVPQGACRELFHTISDKTIQHRHHSSQHLFSPLIKDSTIHFSVT